MYAFNKTTGKQCGLLMENDALLVQSVDLKIIGSARYDNISSSVNHNLSSGTKRVFITVDGMVYIDFDKTAPSISNAPVILNDSAIYLPVVGVKVLNILSQGGSVGIVEFG